MARLQILELPSGSGDDRPAFILVVDECVPQRIALGADATYGDYWQALADRVGARGVIVTPETVEIPANGPAVEPEADDVSEADYTEMATAVRRALGIDITEGKPDVAGWLLAACRELEKSEAARAHVRRERAEARQQVAEYDEALTRVRALSTESEFMNAEQEHPAIWRHGYRCGVLVAQSAACPRDARAATIIKDGESTGRPTHPDGTPYRYHEIKAGGWHHCDGCRTWGQWTAEEPHECPGTFSHGPANPTPGG